MCYSNTGEQIRAEALNSELKARPTPSGLFDHMKDSQLLPVSVFSSDRTHTSLQVKDMLDLVPAPMVCKVTKFPPKLVETSPTFPSLTHLYAPIMKTCVCPLFPESICIMLIPYHLTAHSSILAWTMPWTEKPGGLQSMGSPRVGHDSASFT